MKYKLLRLSLLSALAFLFGGVALGALLSTNDASAEDVTAVWDFHNTDGNYYAEGSANIQGKTGTLDATASDGSTITLEVDATINQGKLYSRGGDAQFNTGTIIKVPVKNAGDEVTVISYPGYHYYTIAGTDAEADEVTYTATTEDTSNRYVEIVATNTAYLYSIKVVHKANSIGGSDDPITEDKTATWDYANEGVMSATLALSGSNGTVKAIEDNGILMTVLANGASFRDNGGNIQVTAGAEFRIPVQSTNDIITVKGYPNYSYYTIGGGEEIRNTNDNPQTEYKAKAADVAQGYVSIVSTNKDNYYYSIKVEQKAPKEATTLDNEAATATFPFDLGTAGQKATFSNADYFLGSKVELGSNMSIYGTRSAGGLNFTGIQPTSDTGETPRDGDYVKFIIQPKFGFTFTPTKVSLKAMKYGTGNGTIDIKWQNTDGSIVSLADSKSVARNNDNPAYTSFEFADELATAIAGEGACGIVVNIYGKLAANKELCFRDIVIEGTLNGTEKEVPILASFKVNGETYEVDKVFGDQYEAELELSKAATMVSADNPLTDLEATSGEVGTLAYDGDDTHCTVTIPMTGGDVSLNYVLNVVQKPDFTVTYIDTDGSQMGTQKVEKDATIGEFACNYSDAQAEDGYKVRGWFYKAGGGQKVTTNDVITNDTKIYAVATEIESSSLSRTYTFNLADPYFYPEDHEAFNITSTKAYFHDTTHGWAVYDSDKIDLLVGPKAVISATICAYGHGTNILVKKGEETLATLDGISEADGGVVAYTYEGEAGTITLEMVASGEMYLHNVKIANIAETNFEQDGQWIFVKKGDVSSFLDALEVANGQNAATTAEPTYIFLPNGTYNLGTTVLTPLSGHNISIIGESQEGVIIKNAPDYTNEGIGTTATLKNSGTNNYLQDLTIQNALDYYGAQDAGMNGGRAVALWDTGNKTIQKNVTLLSYQDTYYTNNANGNYYWETSDIHGTVDFICGEGTLFVENSTLTLEKRKRDGSGENTLTAPSAAAGKSYGYVFNNCTIENKGAGYNLGRAWNNEPRCAYLNTTVSDNQITATRWTAQGMNNNVVAKEFVEYNTKDTNGNIVSPTTNKVDFYDKTNTIHNEMETILTAEQAAKYTIDYVLGSWASTAKDEAIQVEAPEATYADGNVTWTPANNGAIAYALFKNGEFLGITTGSNYAITVDPAVDQLTIRAANSRGGFGEAKVVAGTATGIKAASAAMERGEQVIYNLQGVRVNKATKGLYIVNGRKVVIK